MTKLLSFASSFAAFGCVFGSAWLVSASYAATFAGSVGLSWALFGGAVAFALAAWFFDRKHQQCEATSVVEEFAGRLVQHFSEEV